MKFLLNLMKKGAWRIDTICEAVCMYVSCRRLCLSTMLRLAMFFIEFPPVTRAIFQQ